MKKQKELSFFNVGDQVKITGHSRAKGQFGVIIKNDYKVDGTYFVELEDGHGCWFSINELEDR